MITTQTNGATTMYCKHFVPDYNANLSLHDQAIDTAIDAANAALSVGMLCFWQPLPDGYWQLHKKLANVLRLSRQAAMQDADARNLCPRVGKPRNWLVDSHLRCGMTIANEHNAFFNSYECTWEYQAGRRSGDYSYHDPLDLATE